MGNLAPLFLSLLATTMEPIVCVVVGEAAGSHSSFATIQVMAAFFYWNNTYLSRIGKHWRVVVVVVHIV